MSYFTRDQFQIHNTVLVEDFVIEWEHKPVQVLIGGWLAWKGPVILAVHLAAALPDELVPRNALECIEGELHVRIPQLACNED